jgi:hypothetical protein
MGHVRMMAAVQPFLSGAISKTVNMPETATVEEIEDALHPGLEAGPEGRRHLPRQLQGRPAARHRQEGRRRGPVAAAPGQVVEREVIEEKIVEKVVTDPDPREAAPQPDLADLRVPGGRLQGLRHVGEYDDGRPGEVFLKVAKQGSTLAGVMDALSISISYALQYGVPLRTFVEAFANMRFEPAGMTDDPELRIASSLHRLHLPSPGARLPDPRGASGARHPHRVRAHPAHACRAWRRPWSRTARAPTWPRTPSRSRRRTSWPSRWPTTVARRRAACWTGPGSPTRSRSRPHPHRSSLRPLTPMPHTACSAASRCNGRDPAMPARAVAAPAAVADLSGAALPFLAAPEIS